MTWSPARAEAVDVRVDEFRADATVRILEIEGRSIPGILKRRIEQEIENDTGFSLSTTAPLAISGNIRDLTIDILRTDANGSPLQKIVRIRIDWLAIDETTGEEVVRIRNLLEELEYYTDTYSLELGLTDREAIEENLLIDLAKAVFSELKKSESTLPRPTGKKIVLTEEEKRELAQIGKPEEERKYLSWNLDFQNEVIRVVDGTPAAAGTRKPTTNRFIQSTTVKLEPQKIGENGELKGITIGKYEPNALRELSLQRAEIEYLINEHALTKWGTVSTTLNKFVFDQTVAGGFADIKFKTGGLDHGIQAIGGRDFRPNGLGDLPRWTYGGYWESKWKDILAIKLIGDYSDEDRYTTDASGVRTRQENTIYGSSGKLKVPWTGTEISYDALRSRHKNDQITDSAHLRGNLYQVTVGQKIRNLSLKGDYYFADQNFRTLFGSATSDKKKLTVTGELPGTFDYFEYRLSGEYTQSSKVALSTLEEILLSGSATSTFMPFKKSEDPRLSKLVFPAELSGRRNYDDARVGGTNPGKNIHAGKWLLGAKYGLGDWYTTSVAWSQEVERDDVPRTAFQTDEVKWENTLKYRLWDKFDLGAKGTYRIKDAGGNSDRFVTAGATLGYKLDDFSGQFDYLRDVKRGTVKGQDTTKDRFTLDLSKTFINENFNNTLSLRGDYEKNAFDAPAQNFDRLTVGINLKVAF